MPETAILRPLRDLRAGAPALLVRWRPAPSAVRRSSRSAGALARKIAGANL